MSIEKIEEAIVNIDLDQIRTPNLPMSEALQEADDLAELCRVPQIAERLVAVGQEEDFLEDLVLRVQAARTAQSAWAVVRDRSKDEGLVEVESEAEKLRSAIIAAARWNLRGSKEQATLSSIRGGDSAADLVQDLHDLAQLLEGHLPAFERDRSFDAPAHAQQARELAAKLSGNLSAERALPQPTDVRARRDRAFTYLDDLVTEIRGAGRYAFRNEPSVSKKFASRYRRRTRSKSRRDDADEVNTTDVVEEEVVGEPTAAA